MVNYFFCINFVLLMKKVYIGILAILYMVVSSGMAVQLHYCMGDKVGIELYGSANNTCGKCGMTEKNTGCCHDEFKFYKISDSHKIVTNDIKYVSTFFTIVDNYKLDYPKASVKGSLNASNNYTSPDYSEPEVCILHSTFRI